jgi:hypothetical protein
MAQSKTPTAKVSDEEDDDSKRKVGFLLTPDTDFKLTCFARKHHKNRSEVVEELLVEKLRHVVISFRGKSSKEGEAA